MTYRQDKTCDTLNVSHGNTSRVGCHALNHNSDDEGFVSGQRVGGSVTRDWKVPMRAVSQLGILGCTPKYSLTSSITILALCEYHQSVKWSLGGSSFGVLKDRNEVGLAKLSNVRRGGKRR